MNFEKLNLPSNKVLDFTKDNIRLKTNLFIRKLEYQNMNRKHFLIQYWEL